MIDETTELFSDDQEGEEVAEDEANGNGNIESGSDEEPDNKEEEEEGKENRSTGGMSPSSLDDSLKRANPFKVINALYKNDDEVRGACILLMSLD